MNRLTTLCFWALVQMILFPTQANVTGSDGISRSTSTVRVTPENSARTETSTSVSSTHPATIPASTSLSIAKTSPLSSMETTSTKEPAENKTTVSVNPSTSTMETTSTKEPAENKTTVSVNPSTSTMETTSTKEPAENKTTVSVNPSTSTMETTSTKEPAENKTTVSVNPSTSTMETTSTKEPAENKTTVSVNPSTSTMETTSTKEPAENKTTVSVNPSTSTMETTSTKEPAENKTTPSVNPSMSTMETTSTKEPAENKTTASVNPSTSTMETTSTKEPAENKTTASVNPSTSSMETTSTKEPAENKTTASASPSTSTMETNSTKEPAEDSSSTSPPTSKVTNTPAVNHSTTVVRPTTSAKESSGTVTSAPTQAANQSSSSPISPMTSTPESTKTTLTTSTSSSATKCTSGACLSGSTCIELFNNFTCRCPQGLYYNSTFGCFQVKTFPGTLHINRSFTPDMANNASQSFLETSSEIVSEGLCEDETYAKQKESPAALSGFRGKDLGKAAAEEKVAVIKWSLGRRRLFVELSNRRRRELRKILQGTGGYISSSVLQLQPGSIVATIDNVYQVTSNVNSTFIEGKISDSIKNCTSCGILDRATFSAKPACAVSNGGCDSSSTVCSEKDGDVTCACKEGFLATVYSTKQCVACESGMKAENGECVPCPFGYRGFNCNESYLLAVVVISCVLGGVLLLVLLALLISCCCRARTSTWYSSPYSTDDYMTWPKQEVPKIPRVTTQWDHNNMEMVENGSTRNLVSKDKENGAAKTYDVSVDDLKTFKNKNPSRYSYLCQGQENPYFVSDEEKQKSK